MKSKELRKFSYAYYLRSTALTMPVLPIWWSERPDVGFAIYLSGMAIQGITSTIIDFPLSVWSDKTHPRAPYALGLAIFALAFICASFGNLTGFIAYLISISLAGALMSGSDNALLLRIVGSHFKAELYELNRRFYLYTSGLFLVGVGCYLVSPQLLFMLQAGSLILAAIFIASFSTDPAQGDTAHQAANLETHRVRTTYEGWRIVPTLKWFLVALSVCIIGGEFEAGNQLLNRSVQVLTANVGVPGINGMWSVACLMIITNLVAALGLGRKARIASEKLGLQFTLLVIAFGCIASLLLINSGVLVLIIFGSTLMGTVKGVYRPLLAALAVQTLPAMNWSARWISLTGMVSGLASSLANVSIVYGDPAPSEILNRMAIQILVVTLPLIALISRNVLLKVPLKDKGMSMKTTQRVIHLGSEHPATLEQTYLTASHERAPAMATAQRASGLPHAKIINWDAQRIEFEFVEGTVLDKFKHVPGTDRSEMQADIIRALCDALSLRENNCPKGLPTAADTNFARACEHLCSCQTVAHGDLHPGNILVADDRVVLIDWDQAGRGSRALDELALLTHPDLIIDTTIRGELFKSLIQSHDRACQLRKLDYVLVFRKVLSAKLSDIASWYESSETKRLNSEYQRMMESLS